VDALGAERPGPADVSTEHLDGAGGRAAGSIRPELSTPSPMRVITMSSGQLPGQAPPQREAYCVTRRRMGVRPEVDGGNAVWSAAS
jgi:hypothetical protein